MGYSLAYHPPRLSLIVEPTTPHYAKNASHVASVTVFKREALIESNAQGNHYEVCLSDAVHLISDYLEHRNVSDDKAKRITEHVTRASQRAPQHFSAGQLSMLPRTMRKDLMKHLVTEQVSFVSTLLPDALLVFLNSFCTLLHFYDLSEVCLLLCSDHSLSFLFSLATCILPTPFF